MKRYSEFSKLHAKLGTELKRKASLPPKKVAPNLENRRHGLDLYIKALVASATTANDKRALKWFLGLGMQRRESIDAEEEEGGVMPPLLQQIVQQADMQVGTEEKDEEEAESVGAELQLQPDGFGTPRDLGTPPPEELPTLSFEPVFDSQFMGHAFRSGFNVYGIKPVPTRPGCCFLLVSNVADSVSVWFFDTTSGLAGHLCEAFEFAEGVEMSYRRGTDVSEDEFADVIDISPDGRHVVTAARDVNANLMSLYVFQMGKVGSDRRHEWDVSLAFKDGKKRVSFVKYVPCSLRNEIVCCEVTGDDLATAVTIRAGHSLQILRQLCIVDLHTGLNPALFDADEQFPVLRGMAFDSRQRLVCIAQLKTNQVEDELTAHHGFLLTWDHTKDSTPSDDDWHGKIQGYHKKLAISGDGTRIATISETIGGSNQAHKDEVIVRDEHFCQLARLAEMRNISFLAFDDSIANPDGTRRRCKQLLTIQGFRKVVIYSTITFAPQFVIEKTSWMPGACWLPNGIVYAICEANTIRKALISAPAQMWRKPLDIIANKVAFSEDQQTIAILDQGGTYIELFKLKPDKTGQYSIIKIGEHTLQDAMECWQMELSPCSEEGHPLYLALRGGFPTLPGKEQYVMVFSIVPRGEVGGKGGYGLQEVQTGAGEEGLTVGAGCAFCFVRDSSAVVLGDAQGKVKVVGIGEGGSIREIGDMKEWCLDVAVDYTGHFVACSDFGQDLALWHIDGSGNKWELRTRDKPLEDIGSIQFVEGEAYILIMAKEAIRFLSIDSGEDLRQLGFQLNIADWSTLAKVHNGMLCSSCGTSIQLWSNVGTTEYKDEWSSAIVGQAGAMEKISGVCILDGRLFMIGPSTKTGEGSVCKMYGLARFEMQPAFADVMRMVETESNTAMLKKVLHTYPQIVNAAHPTSGRTLVHFAAESSRHPGLLECLLAAEVSIGLLPFNRPARAVGAELESSPASATWSTPAKSPEKSSATPGSRSKTKAFVELMELDGPAQGLKMLSGLPNQVCERHWETALHLAIARKSKPCVSALLEVIEENIHTNLHLYTGTAATLLASEYPELLNKFLSTACFATVPDCVAEGVTSAQINEGQFIVKGSSRTAPVGFWKQQLEKVKRGCYGGAVFNNEQDGRQVEVEACIHSYTIHCTGRGMYRAHPLHYTLIHYTLHR
jgi:hypothetical protein